jgi:hypothetical protein
MSADAHRTGSVTFECPVPPRRDVVRSLCAVEDVGRHDNIVVRRAVAIRTGRRSTLRARLLPMSKTRTLRPVGIEYLGTAPVRATLRQTIPASAGETFRSLEDPDSWPVWLDPIDSVVWTSPQPFGVGTTRDVTGRAGLISERFWAWDDGRRMSFCFTETTVPIFGAFCEDYEVVPTGDDECVLVWRYGFECRSGFRLVQPIVAAVFKRMGGKALGQLAEYMHEHRSRYASTA